MARERLTPDDNVILTGDQVAAATQAEALRAARTGLNNALTNAGLTNPTTAAGAAPFTQPMTIAGATPAPAAPTVDPLKNKATKPAAPAGYHYTWIGGTTTGQWQLYKDVPGAPTGTSGASTGGTTGAGGGVTTPTPTPTLTPTKPTATAPTDTTNQTRSAYNIIKQEFEARGLGSLIPELQTIMQQGLTDASEIRLYLQNTDAYKKRFAANQDRIKNGLQALTPAEYISLEDKYQSLMRNYGLPESYWSKDALGTQAGFNKLIANDVDPTELEDRILTAQKRVLNADPNVMDALKRFYPNLTSSDLLAYTLDPTNALENIKRKVTAAEIGGAALAQGLGAEAARAEELAKYGITKAQAQQGYATIGEFLPTAEKLSSIYGAQGLGALDQAQAEAEVFNTAGAAEAARKRKKLSQLEQAAFGGSSGISSGALNRDRASAYAGYREPGAGQF